MFFEYGVLQEAGGYELTSAMNSAFKNAKYDEIKVKTLNSDNLSSNTGNISNLNITHISSNGHELGEEWTFVLEDGTPITKTVLCYNK